MLAGSRQPRQRIFELDVLRGIAILLVMGAHVPAFPIWPVIGGYGVDLFFVLSGFLISNLLFTEYRATGGIGLKRFWLRRALKLYPSFYLLLGLTLLYGWIWRVPFSASSIVGEAILTQNYIGSIWGHTWSLAVEEHFYILLPLLLAWLMQRSRGSKNPFDAIPYIFAGVAAACLALRIVNAMEHPVFSHRANVEPTHFRVDALFFGVFLSYLHNFRPQILARVMSDPWRFPVSVLGVLCFAPAAFLFMDNPIVYTIGFTTIYVSFGTMLLMCLYTEKRKRPSPGPTARAIAKMGVYSYTIYLWHVPMAQVFMNLSMKFPQVNQYLMWACYFASSVIAGVALSRLVEIPVLTLRQRFFPPVSNKMREEKSFQLDPVSAG